MGEGCDCVQQATAVLRRLVKTAWVNLERWDRQVVWLPKPKGGR
jgi:hypothetical protein